MAKVAVFIHGTWAKPDVWRNWRPFGTTSLGGHVADFTNTIEGLTEKPVLIGHSTGGLLTPAPDAAAIATRLPNLRAFAFARIQLEWGWWRKPHRAMLAEAQSHTFNTTDPREGAEPHSAFVSESGRTLLEIALPWLDGSKTRTVDPRLVTVPLLPRRSARRFGHVADYLEYPIQGHWVLGQPGWQAIAEDTVAWLDGKAA